MGRFLVRIFGPALEEYGGQRHDSARFRRAANLLKLQEKWELLRSEYGVTAEPTALPLKFGAALLEAAAVEEDEELQDIFAKLLFNTTDACSRAETRQAFVAMLREMNGLDVRVLFALAEAPDAHPALSPIRTVFTAKLPDGFVPTGKQPDGKIVEPPEAILIALNNLARLGCVVPAGVLDGGVSYGLVTFTPLGQALVKACSTPSPPQ